jgi:hypothetical protein
MLIERVRAGDRGYNAVGLHYRLARMQEALGEPTVISNQPRMVGGGGALVKRETNLIGHDLPGDQ